MKNSDLRQNSEQTSADYNEVFKIDMSFEEAMKIIAKGENKEEK